MIVICDLDGTLADHEHRFEFAADKMWHDYHKRAVWDKPYHGMVPLLHALACDGHKIHIWTGRPDTYRAMTLDWLRKWDIPFDYLRMREFSDKRRDVEMKGAWADALDAGDVLCVFEDRVEVVEEVWRARGFLCFQPRECYL